MIRPPSCEPLLQPPYYLCLPSESVGYLVPLLADKDEFVRREVAFALGKTHNQMAAQPLIERLTSDKKDSVRGAAAVALGELKEAAATVKSGGDPFAWTR